MSDDRSDRLRRRRSESKPDERDETDKTSESSKPSEQSKQDERGEKSVKDEQVGTYMYLPEGQAKEMQRLYNVLKAEYEYEYDVDFEKNRHFYPLLIKYGLDGLEDLDALELKEKLETI